MVTLCPRFTITASSDPDVAMQVHSKGPGLCFIARSVNFPSHHESVITVEGDPHQSDS